MDQVEDYDTYQCVNEIMNKFDDGNIECKTCRPACQ